MEIKVKRTTFPAAMRAAVAEHAAAIVAGDERGAARWVSESASAAVIARIVRLRPLSNHTVIAEARLGFQYIVKVRFHGAKGDATIQYRLACVRANAQRKDSAWEKDDRWQIVELDDLEMHSPWQRPSETEIAKDAEMAKVAAMQSVKRNG
jgi:hypothetical protein